MKLQRLFDLRVRHDFHPGGRCTALRVTPRADHPDGERALARHRLLARPLPDGVEVVGPVDGEGKPLIALADDLRLAFDVSVVDPEFAHYTDLDAWAGDGIPLYRGSAPAGGALTLARAPARAPAVVAGIEVVKPTAAWLVKPPSFTLELKARKALWVYYLLTSRPGAAPPEIRDGEVDRDLSFARELLKADVVSATDDPIGHRLAVGDPERRCYRFTSAQPIACSRAPLRQLALYRGDELLIRELSNPSPQSHATIKVAPNEAPRASLFRVIEY